MASAAASVRPLHANNVAGRNGARGAAPGWDEQIVPTLRKRLESESAYLTHRLSSTQFDDTTPHPTTGLGLNVGISPSYTHSHSLQHANGDVHAGASHHARTTTFPSSEQTSTTAGGSGSGSGSAFSARSRTKSGPMASPPMSSRGGSQRLPRVEQPGAAAGAGSRQPSSSRSKSTRQPSVSPQPDTGSPRMYGYGSGSGSGSSSPNANIPSRIPTRPRSKSQLVPRPSLPQSASGPVPRVPSPPELTRGSSKTRAGGSSAVAVKREPSGIFPTINGFTGHQLERGGSEGRRDSHDSGRDSLRFEGSRITEGFIKNELPPFRMAPEEALRIAQRGHDLVEDDAGWRESYHSRGDEDEAGRDEMGLGLGDVGEKRKRAVTMRGGMDDVGLGQPPGRAGSNRTPKQRAGSARPANIQTPPSNFQGPRSASLNLLASTPNTGGGTPTSMPTSASRLGIAAHLIPPESTYTPPKGANWDEVLLPTVAKKLGMGDEKGSPSPEDGREEDLAVEWDKDGTPVRWVKRKPGERRNGDMGNGAQNDSTPTHSSFNPTFEPSPDNPLRPGPLRYQRSKDNIELSPLRTHNGQPTTLTDNQPVSPAPFSSFAPNATHHSHNHFPPPSPSRSTSSSALGRKPSLLRKPSIQQPSHQTSQMSLRSQYAAVAGTGGQQWGVPPVQPHTPGTTNRITDAVYANSRAMREGSTAMLGLGQQDLGMSDMGRRQGQGQGKRRKEEESHGKGCGCVVM
ncbi:hypothetical protein IAT38_004898 [Cryptococcus sp. DSM 104549]